MAGHKNNTHCYVFMFCRTVLFLRILHICRYIFCSQHRNASGIYVCRTFSGSSDRSSRSTYAHLLARFILLDGIKIPRVTLRLNGRYQDHRLSTLQIPNLLLTYRLVTLTIPSVHRMFRQKPLPCFQLRHVHNLQSHHQ